MRPIHLVLTLLAGLAAGCTCEEMPAQRRAPGEAPAQPAPPAPRGAPITAAWSDNFDRAELGPDWHATAPAYRIENGALVTRTAYNHPLWLTRPLPRDAKIEFDCWSESDAGDLKVEVWGDGRSSATTRGQYTSTAYNFIFGGWNNQISTLARLNEHGADRKERSDVKVKKGQKYHWVITRKGGKVEWSIDGQPFLAYDDTAPLDGDDHRHFAINDWQAELHFDNLTITPL